MLTLDHFYFITSKERFNDLLNKEELKGLYEHSVVNSSKGSWEGLYIRCSDNTYLEILLEGEETKPHHHGICLYNLEEDFRIKDYLDKLSFKEEIELSSMKTKDDMPWFDSIGFKDYNREFYIWASQYLDKKLETRRKYDEMSSGIAYLLEAKFHIDKSVYNKSLDKVLKFDDIKSKLENDSTTLYVPINKSDRRFKIQVSNVEKERYIKLKKEDGTEINIEL